MSIHFKNQIKMSENIELSYLWEHTITKIFKHDHKSEVGIKIRQWVIYNKLKIFNSILNYPIDDFTPSGNLCYMNEHGDILPLYTNKKIFNLTWYIQHLMDESEDEAQNPLSEENWIKQNNCKFIKYVIHHRHPMTPGQLKQKPYEEIFEKVDTDEGESTKVQEEFTTSEELTEEEYSTFSDMSKKESESDINIDDTSEDENITEIETFEHYGEKIHETEESIPVETSQVLTVFNKTIHHEDDSSDDKSEIEIEPPKENGDQEIGKQDKLLATTFQMEIKNQKLKGS